MLEDELEEAKEKLQIQESTNLNQATKIKELKCQLLDAVFDDPVSAPDRTLTVRHDALKADFDRAIAKIYEHEMNFASLKDDRMKEVDDFQSLRKAFFQFSDKHINQSNIDTGHGSLHKDGGHVAISPSLIVEQHGEQHQSLQSPKLKGRASPVPVAGKAFSSKPNPILIKNHPTSVEREPNLNGKRPVPADFNSNPMFRLSPHTRKKNIRTGDDEQSASISGANQNALDPEESDSSIGAY